MAVALEHGQIWQTPSGDKVGIIIPQGGQTIFFTLLNSAHGGPPANATTVPRGPGGDNSDLLPEGSVIVQSVPAANPNNFNMSGDDARTLQTAVLVLSQRQQESNQKMLDRLGAISQVQPPQGA